MPVAQLVALPLPPQDDGGEAAAWPAAQVQTPPHAATHAPAAGASEEAPSGVGAATVEVLQCVGSHVTTTARLPQLLAPRDA